MAQNGDLGRTEISWTLSFKQMLLRTLGVHHICFAKTSQQISSNIRQLHSVATDAEMQSHKSIVAEL